MIHIHIFIRTGDNTHIYEKKYNLNWYNAIAIANSERAKRNC